MVGMLSFKSFILRVTDPRTIGIPLGGYGRHLITLSPREVINFAKVSIPLAIDVLTQITHSLFAALHGYPIALRGCHHQH